MIKKAGIFIMSVMIGSFGVTALAQNNKLTADVVDHTLVVNDEEQVLKNDMLLINNRTYLPVRETSELLNLYVVWDGETQTIKISNIGVTAENTNKPVVYSSAFVSADITDIKLKIDGYEKQPDDAVIIVDGTSYLPLRYLAETLGFNVEWDGNTQTVSITSKDNMDKDEEYDFLLPFMGENDLYGYMDCDGNVIVEPKYTYAGEFAEGMALVSDKEEALYDWEGASQYGYINAKGEEIIPCKYYGFHNFSDGLAAVCEKLKIEYRGDTEFMVNKYSYIDKSGKVVVEGDFYEAGNFNSGYATAVILDGDNYQNVYIDKKGNVVKNFGASEIDDFKNGYAKADDKIIDTSFNTVLDFARLEYKPFGDVENGMIVCTKTDNGMYGVIDLSGNVIIPFEYSWISLNSRNPICAAKKDGSEEYYGYIDLNNNVIIPFEFFDAKSFAGDTAFVKNSDDAYSVSVIDKNGDYIKRDIKICDNADMLTSKIYPNGIRKYQASWIEPPDNTDGIIYISPNGEIINKK